MNQTYYCFALLMAFVVAAQATVDKELDEHYLDEHASSEFYKPPANLSSYSPGDIVRSKKLNDTGSYDYRLAYVESKYRIFYRTTDSHGNPVGAVTTVLIPHHPRNDRLISYQFGIYTASPKCPPSTCSFSSVLPSSLVNVLLQRWVTVVPDHFSVNNAFGANILGGQAILDSIRAASSFDGFNFTKDMKVALWGFDAASAPTAFAAELQPEYAPDVPLAGMVIGDLMANTTGNILKANKNESSYLIPSLITGISKEYDVINKTIIENLNPSQSRNFLSSERACYTTLTTRFKQDDVLEMWNGGADVFKYQNVSDIMKNLTCGHRKLPIPAMIYHSIAYDLNVVTQVDDAVSSYCEFDSTIEYIKVTDTYRDVSSSFTTLSWFHDRVKTHMDKWNETPLNWTADRLNGKSLKQACRTRTTAQLPQTTYGLNFRTTSHDDAPSTKPLSNSLLMLFSFISYFV
ncbi:hypothetical protein TRICI_002948 [Trichomonascus ciferrii]|uniref:Triacylglycerol lipase n=1 Tax=Trichomonascus ciferrii TaxID=44093 RepID=A0A642V563_9ASCO|nr:hypothetical protein TRICI_002948 [Trichomonascus ciferrii]